MTYLRAFGKVLERANKRLWYALFRLLFGNKPSSLPLDKLRTGNILILRYDAIGDMIVTTPVFRLIKSKVPEAKIHVVCSPRNEEIAKVDPHVAKTWVLRKRTLWEVLRLRWAMASESFDVVFAFVLHRTTEGGLVANLVGGRHSIKVTFEHDTRKELYQTFFNAQVPVVRDSATMNELQVYVVSKCFGWNYDRQNADARLAPGPENVRHAKNYVETSGSSRRVLLNLSAGVPWRMWSQQRWIALIEQLLIHDSSNQYYIMHMAEQDEIASGILARFPTITTDYRVGRSLMDSAALVQQMDLVVSPDTSIVHMAAAFGKPLVVMFTPNTNFINEWMPFGVPFWHVIAPERQPIEAILPGQVAELCHQAFDFLARTSQGVDIVRS